MALSLAFSASYSYCEPFSYGITSNAASSGLNWSMAPVLPSVTGLSVNGLAYRYTAIKDPSDPMVVSVGNLNAQGDGYIFRESDDWSGLPGNTITRSFSLSNIPSGSWGDGSVDVDGQGSVENAFVAYSYRIDECYDPQLNPACPGYITSIEQIAGADIYNALEDDAVVGALGDTEFEYDEDGNLIENDDEEEMSRLELGLTASANALTLFAAQGQSQTISQMNLGTNLVMYYNSTINGGIYGDVNNLTDANLPDNSKGLRNNLAQQLLHEQLVQMQYE